MNRWKGIALGMVAATLMVPAAMGQGAKSGSAETGLLGVKLYDKNLVLIQKFGSPDEIQAVTIGGSGVSGSNNAGAPGGNGGPATGPGAMGPPPGFRPGGGKGGSAASADFSFPLMGDNTVTLNQRGAPAGAQGPTMPGAEGPQAGASAAAPGGPRGGFGPGKDSGINNGANTGGGNTDVVQYTRWVYNRNNNKYGFVIDKFGRVVQIEAVGLESKSVGTKRGIKFGSSFAQVMKAYQNPDAYEINGDTVVVRYLSRSKVAFRLSRLGTKKPQVVTGIVVAASKG